jgi:hypothetical protein
VPSTAGLQLIKNKKINIYFIYKIYSASGIKVILYQSNNKKSD